VEIKKTLFVYFVIGKFIAWKWKYDIG